MVFSFPLLELLCSKYNAGSLKLPYFSEKSTISHSSASAISNT